MAATTGVLMALFTTDWSRATNLVPGGKSSMTGFSSSAAVAALAPPLGELLWTLRTNTSEGLRRSSDAGCTEELEGARACWLEAVSEKLIFPRAYGPAFLVTGVVEDFGCTPIAGCAGRAVLPTSSGVTPWLPGASGCPVCAFSRGVTDPVWSVACWPGVSLRPKSGAPTRLASVDFLAVLEEENTPRNTRSTAMAAPASRKSERLLSRPSSRRFVTWCSREVFTPNPIGANAGRSTAPDSATCNKSISCDCLYGGRSNTTTPSARSEGPNRRLFSRKSSTCNCSAVDHFSCRISFPEVVLPPSCTCGGINRIACLVGFTTENKTTTC